MSTILPKIEKSFYRIIEVGMGKDFCFLLPSPVATV